MHDDADAAPPTSAARFGAAIDRRTVLKRGAAAGLLLAVPSFLAACGSGSGTTTAASSTKPVATTGKAGGRFRFAIAYDSAAGTFDPARESVDADGCRRTNTFDTLMALRGDHTPELRLAESIEPSADFRTWTIRLRDGVVFHDGSKLSADDLIYSLKRILDPKTASGRASFYSALRPNRIRKVDRLTVELKLDRPDSDMPLAFALTEVVKDGATDASFKTKPVGTGPFKVVSVNMGRQIIWERFADYWGPDQPLIDRLELTVIPDPGARLNALLSGQVDAIERVAPAQFAQLERNPNVRAIARQSNSIVPFTTLGTKAPFDRPEVRQALRLIVDRKQLVESAFSGRGKIANDLYGQGQPLFASDLPQREQDLDKAKALLKKAGIGRTPITLVTSDLTPGMLEAATAFAQQASQAGLTVKLRKLTSDSYFGTQWPYPFGQSAWGDIALPQFFRLGLATGAPFAETQLPGAAWQKRYVESQRTDDPARKKAIYHDLQSALWDDGGYVQWSDSEYLDATSAKVSGISDRPTYPLGAYDFRAVSVA